MEVRMLQDFVFTYREEIISRCQGKVAKRLARPLNPGEMDHGVPMFLDELAAELREGLSANPDISKTAARHGHDMLVHGYTPAQVVHNYGDVCQSITELALEKKATISTDDFRMLNRCLDDAIASSITQYGDERNAAGRDELDDAGNRVRVLMEELSAAIRASRQAFEAIETGKVGAAGSVGRMLDVSLQRAEDCQNRLEAELEAVEQPQTAT
jgi:hypothetical protein